MKILLYAPEYRPNLSNMIRSAEFFGYQEVFIYDQNGLLDPPSNKVSRSDMAHMARVWTAGALDYVEIRKVDDILGFLKNYPGRKIATVIDPKADSLKEFNFEQTDLLLMGAEKEGLPADIVELCEGKVYLPAIGHTDCLNVSVSLGIFLYEYEKQFGHK